MPATAYYPLQDTLYRTTALTDDAGDIVEAYDYDAYGNTLIFTAAGTGSDWWADDATQSAIPTFNKLYCGYYYDPETGIYFVNERYYNSQQGRFISRDQMEYIDGMSLYAAYFAMFAVTDPTGNAIPALAWPIAAGVGRGIAWWLARREAARAAAAATIITADALYKAKRAAEEIKKAAAKAAREYVKRCDEMHKAYHVACDTQGNSACPEGLACEAYIPILAIKLSCIAARQAYLDADCDFAPGPKEKYTGKIGQAKHKAQLAELRRIVKECEERREKACQEANCHLPENDILHA